MLPPLCRSALCRSDGCSDRFAGPFQDFDGTVWRFAGDRLSAVETVYNAKTHMQARKRLAGAPIDRASLVAAGMDTNVM
ncbi:hypothetical protein ACFQFQ_23715 [Sulfitobacter porphyrae]|uniref:Uncharacterized protein n=1 Tax=Sulfitobacter porphyrae TaxID=1246864 RepID=A0ABW2B801_9RHOB